MQLDCRSPSLRRLLIQRVLMDVRLDQRRHEAGDRLAAPQPLADRGRRDVGRRLPRSRWIAGAPVTRPASGGRAHARGERRQPRRQRRRARDRARDHDEVREVEHLGIALPGRNICERVGAGDEEDLRRAQAARVQPIQRVGGIRRAVRAAARRRSPGAAQRPTPPGRPSQSGGTATPSAAAAGAAESCEGTTSTPAEIERVAGGDSRGQVPAVNRVERAAEQADSCHSCIAVRGGLTRLDQFLPDRFEQQRQPLAGGRRDRVERNPSRCKCARSRSSRDGSSSASILFAAATTGLSCSRSPVASRPGTSPARAR